MAEFAVTVERIRDIEPIEGADRIELAVIGEYRSIVAKGSFKAGDLAVYIPEQSILPEWLITRLGLEGKLSGGQKNRVKAIRLKGCLSQGLIYPVHMIQHTVLDKLTPCVQGPSTENGSSTWCYVEEDEDVTALLGIRKYDPAEALDANMRRKLNGECVYIPGFTKKYDLENWKKHSNVFKDGEIVSITEKLHGTLCCFAYWPGLNHPELPNDTYVYSKGLGGSGQVFKWNEANAENLYIKAFHSQTIVTKRNEYSLSFDDGSTLANLLQEPDEDHYTITARLGDYLYHEGIHSGPFFLFGEVYGAGVQDLGYGEAGPKFRAFDLWLGDPQSGAFVGALDKRRIFEAIGVESVPLLYVGPYSREIVLELTDGKTTLGGSHTREGIVITPIQEQWENRLGRKVLKNVSGDYLTRKGNTTEFS